MIYILNLGYVQKNAILIVSKHNKKDLYKDL